MRSDESPDRAAEVPSPDAAPSGSSAARKDAPPPPAPAEEEMGGEAPCQLHRWWDADEEGDDAST